MFIVDHVSLLGNGRPRLNNVSLTISGRRTAVMGYSGAGKTSLLNLLAGFEACDGGTIRFSPPGAGKRPSLFWVPQNGGLWPHLSVEQHLQSVNKSRELTDEILLSLDLDHRKAAFPELLSQGEQSRLSLARALATEAEVLLMDEPLSHVDPVRKPGYWDVITRLADRSNSSLVFSSHEPETVLRRSESLICLHEGTVAFQGLTRNLYDAPATLFLAEFLGPINWWTKDEAANFGIDNVPSDGCGIRPERLSVVVNETGLCEYVKRIFDGPYSESLIRSVQTGASRIVKHLRPEVPLADGVRISLNVVEL